MMQNFWETYQYPIIFGLFGLLLAILFLTFGVAKTFLLLILTGIGISFGFYLRSIQFFDRFK